MAVSETIRGGGGSVATSVRNVARYCKECSMILLQFFFTQVPIFSALLWLKVGVIKFQNFSLNQTVVLCHFSLLSVFSIHLHTYMQ